MRAIGKVLVKALKAVYVLFVFALVIGSSLMVGWIAALAWPYYLGPLNDLQWHLAFGSGAIPVTVILTRFWLVPLYGLERSVKKPREASAGGGEVIRTLAMFMFYVCSGMFMYYSWFGLIAETIVPHRLVIVLVFWAGGAWFNYTMAWPKLPPPPVPVPYKPVFLDHLLNRKIQ